MIQLFIQTFAYLTTYRTPDSDQDALRLAQLHFANGSYPRAQSLLSRYNLETKNPECKYLTAHCHMKQGQLDEALEVLGERPPAYLLQASHNSRPKIAPGDIHAKHGSHRHAKTVTKRDRSTSPTKNVNMEEAKTRRFEGGMCHLRGVCFARQNSFDRAKQCYMDAVRIDVQCYEAFDQLTRNALMSPQEEWSFLESLNFDSITADSPYSSQQAADLTQKLYITRLSKYRNPEQYTNAVDTLSTHYRLTSNPDLLLSKAELLFTQCRFKEALHITTAVFEADRHNLTPLPIHLACLHELQEKSALQLLAHDLTDRHPDDAATWLAVGVYYLTTNNIASARRFFSKSSQMDPHYGPAWIGFAHTFAAEGEHDQAINAYSTASRLFQGTHLPHLFLGMQSLQNNNMHLASEFLMVAYGLCRTDPLLLNELGVVAYHEDDLSLAIRYFEESLEQAMDTGADPRASLSTRINLGHAHRRAGGAGSAAGSVGLGSDEHHERALMQFNEVLRQGGRDAAVFAAKGMVLLELGRVWDAVVALHESLAVNPLDPVANELLVKALEESAASEETGTGRPGGLGDTGAGPRELYGVQTEYGDEVDAWVEARKREALGASAARRAKKAAAGREETAVFDRGKGKQARTPQGKGKGKGKATGVAVVAAVNGLGGDDMDSTDEE